MNSPDSPFIVTRPAPDHLGLMGRLVEAGITAIHSPAFDIEAAPEPLLDDRIGSLTGFDIVIVTSPVAARLIVERAAATDVRDVRFLAPGQGTASLLQAGGLRCGFPDGGGTSEHVLAMPELVDAEGSRIAIVGAPGGRGLIGRELSRRGARVEAVHVYRRKTIAPAPALIDALREGSDPVVLISSRQAFDLLTESLCGQSRPAWLSARFVVSSGRLEAACRSAGVLRIRRAEGAADERMLAAAVQAGWISRAQFARMRHGPPISVSIFE